MREERTVREEEEMEGCEGRGPCGKGEDCEGRRSHEGRADGRRGCEEKGRCGEGRRAVRGRENCEGRGEDGRL